MREKRKKDIDRGRNRRREIKREEKKEEHEWAQSSFNVNDPYLKQHNQHCSYFGSMFTCGDIIYRQAFPQGAISSTKLISYSLKYPRKKKFMFSLKGGSRVWAIAQWCNTVSTV